MTSLRARVQRDELLVDVAFRAIAGGVVALMGPNGAGKTTVLRALAGLESGDPAPGVGSVFQDLRLFPHLSALDNVAFAHEARGSGRRAARASAVDDLGRMGVAHLASRRPSELSGGEAQRVALARGLVGDPDLLLLDEPFAALDAAARQELRRDLPAVLRRAGRATVMVTHDPVDALVLADRVVVIEHGRVTHDASASEITRHPHTRWAARLLGINLVRGTATTSGVETTTGATITTADDLVPGEPMLARFDPASVVLHVASPTGGSARNRWQGEVVGIDAVGSRVRVDIAGAVPLVAEVTPESVETLGLGVGSPVWAVVKAAEVSAYPASAD